MAALLLGVGGALSGNPLLGIVGYLAGSYIDKKFLGPAIGPHSTVEDIGPRLDSLNIMSSAEGSPVLRCYGRIRIDTQLIWSTNFHEIVHTSTSHESVGGKGSLTGVQNVTTNTTTYTYQISFAVGLCEGPIVDIGGVWADGKPLDMSNITWRLYKGDEAQGPDPKIEAVEGSGTVPAFRGLAYLVFEEIQLAPFGNRIPQLTVEVIRRPPADDVRLEDILTGITMIPGLGEFIYATDSIYRTDDLGQSAPENRHGNSGKPDCLVALDQLQSGAPNIDAVSLVVSWHGTDLRCGECQIKPKVEFGAGKDTTPWPWMVSGIDRPTADIVSYDGFGALLGGAPSDRSVVQAITEIKTRSLKAVLYPFITMDVPSGNALPNPYSNNAATNGQPTFPWRGRITCSPAAGYTGTVDKTATAATQVDAFFGTAAPGDFGLWDGNTIPYSGPDEWSYRRMVLHYAHLAVAAGGIDAFLIGSEMVALNAIRSNATTFPAVAAMAALATDVKAIFTAAGFGSSCKVGYAADWSEFINYRPGDGSNDLFFHLDPLWSNSAIDFIGIDNDMPLSDWRDGTSHLDAIAGAPSIYDQTYLQGNIEGGELYDWYYASSSDRTAQVRTNITDGAYSEPWVYRYKDIRSWWLNSHYNRPAGVRAGSPTAWTPQSKPIWFTEFGCPAIDKGSNQPNVFYDPKSSESFFPYFSVGRRDDLIQRSFLEALITYWDPANSNNPTSAVYLAPMIDNTRIFAWTWDARPYAQFPNNSLTWRDGPNWRRGHWLTGRLGLVPLADVVTDITKGLGVTVDVSQINGIVRGYTIDNLMSPRGQLGPLMQIFFFDAVESAGQVRFVQRGGPIVGAFGLPDLVDTGGSNQQDGGSFYTLTRGQETDLPGTAHLQFLDPDNDYQVGDVYSRRLRGSSQNSINITPAIVLDASEAQGIVDILLTDAWVMRERGTLILPPSSYALEPTDVINVLLSGRTFQMRLDEIGYQHNRPATLVRTDPASYVAADGAVVPRQRETSVEPGPAIFQFMDLPILNSSEAAGVPRFGAYASPWARVNVYRSPTTTNYEFDQILIGASTIGKTLYDFYSGPLWRWDDGNSLYVRLPTTQPLASVSELQTLNGSNICAVQNPDGQWEIIQFVTAELIGGSQYKLSQLLRGRFGSEYAMRDPVPLDAPFIILDETVVQSTANISNRGLPLNYKWGPATKPIDDPTYQSATLTFKGIGLQPYSPCHLSATWEASGAIQLGWIRRTRIDGDNWDQPDVPLGEESELYDIEIMDAAGTTVVRTITGVGAPAYRYDVSVQIADFGAPLTSIKFRVYQYSSTYGRGAVAVYG